MWNELNARWARNVCNNNPYPSGSFVLAVSEAYLKADQENKAILEEEITELREKYPKWNIEEAA